MPLTREGFQIKIFWFKGGFVSWQEVHEAMVIYPTGIEGLRVTKPAIAGSTGIPLRLQTPYECSMFLLESLSHEYPIKAEAERLPFDRNDERIGAGKFPLCYEYARTTS